MISNLWLYAYPYRPPQPPQTPTPGPSPPNKKQHYKTEKCSSEDNKPSIRLLELLVDKFSISFWRSEKLSVVGCSESSPVVLDRRGLLRKPFRDEPAKSEIGNPSFEWCGYVRLWLVVYWCKTKILNSNSCHF